MHAVGSARWGLSKPYRGPRVEAVLLEHEQRGSPRGRESRRDTHHRRRAAGVLKVENWTSLELTQLLQRRVGSGACDPLAIVDSRLECVNNLIKNVEVSGQMCFKPSFT